MKCWKVHIYPKRMLFLNGRRTSENSLSPRASGRSRAKNINSHHSDILKHKVSRVLRDELTDIICSCDIKANNYPPERLLQGVSVVDVDFATDLSVAKVSLSIFGNSVEKRQVYVWLCNNIGQVRYSLSQRLKDLRKIPEIRFLLADTQSSQYLNQVLDEISVENVREGVLSDEIIDFEEVNQDGEG
mmetsp:Transcript_23445/g.47118  ORF Transcript_23445/g.47118 Transcript_23445/m.47118 type:complete len:187 (-) Transcript_23445:74-634(-)